MSLSDAEKERLLRALEEDREFRYALMGLLGFREILDRITRLEERQQLLEERFTRLEERFAKLEERFAQLKDRFAELEERFARLEERFAELAERQQRLEERFAELEERFTRLEERQQRLEERFAELLERQQVLEERFARLEERVLRVEERLEQLDRTLATVAHRFGVLSEHAFREAVKGILQRYFGATAQRWSVYDEEGLVYGYPSMVEVDVVVRDGVHILVEVKSRVDAGDVVELSRIARLYEKRVGIRPRPVIVAGYVAGKAREAAARLGVEIYTYMDTE